MRISEKEDSIHGGTRLLGSNGLEKNANETGQSLDMHVC